MTVRVYRNSLLENSTGFNYGASYLHFLAQAFSLDAGWNIIDSYNSSASPQRYKGDPMTGGIGGLWGGVPQTSMPNNCWFVIEQVTPEPTFEKMQVKFQCSGNANYACPSGIDYGLEGVNRLSGCRFAPFGGWIDSDVSPDFENPTTKVSRDMEYLPWPSGSSSKYRSWLIVDDDYFFAPQFQPQTYIDFKNGVFYIGRYTPLRAGQHTPDHPCYMCIPGTQTGSDVFWLYWEGSQSRWFFKDHRYDNSSRGFRVSCPDEHGIVKEWEVMHPNIGTFWDGSASPNEFDAATPTLDLIEVPFMGLKIDGDEYSPDSRIIGRHKHLWMGHGMGYGAFIDSRSYMPCGANQVCVVTEWDGSSDFIP